MSLPLFKIKLKLNPLIQKSTHPNSHLNQKMEVLYDFSTKKSDKTQSWVKVPRKCYTLQISEILPPPISKFIKFGQLQR